MSKKDERGKIGGREAGLVDVRLFALIAKGLLYEQETRRKVLFFIVLGALLMVFVGAVPLNGWLGENVLAFIFYWLLCAWLTFTSILLALFDLLMVRRSAREARRRLKAEAFGSGTHPADPEP